MKSLILSSSHYPPHHHIAHSLSTIGQHCGFRRLIYYFSYIDQISHLRLTVYFNTVENKIASQNENTSITQ